MRASIRDFASYEDACRGFQLEIPERFNLVEVLRANSSPERQALICAGREGSVESMSFGQLEEATARLGSSLRRRGLGRGKRIAVTLPTTPEAAITILAAMRIGAVPACIRLGGPADAWRHQLGLVRPDLVVCASTEIDELRSEVDSPLVTGDRGDWAAMMSGASRVAEGDAPAISELLTEGVSDDPVEPTAAVDPAFITFTSGSMGTSKAVVFSHGSFLPAVPAFEMFTNLAPIPGDVFFNSLGWATGGGLRTMVIPAWFHGRPVVGIDHPASGMAVVEILSRLRVTVAVVMAGMLRELREAGDLVGSDFDWSALRVIAYGGEGISSELQAWVERTLGVVVQTYLGAAEMAYVASACSAWFPSRAGEVGRLVPGREVAVLDEGSLEPLEREAPGMLAVRRTDRALTLGYLREAGGDPGFDASSATDEFFLTGDLAVISELGDVTYLGRSGQVILSATGPIAPMAVEDAILTVGDVREASAVPVAAGAVGAVHACVSLTTEDANRDALAREIADVVASRFDGAVHVSSVVVFDELPKTRGTGKINRRLAAEAIATGEPAPLATITVGAR
jgi:acetyl-CoA synthetase